MKRAILIALFWALPFSAFSADVDQGTYVDEASARAACVAFVAGRTFFYSCFISSPGVMQTGYSGGDAYQWHFGPNGCPEGKTADPTTGECKAPPPPPDCGSTKQHYDADKGRCVQNCVWGYSSLGADGFTCVPNTPQPATGSKSEETVYVCRLDPADLSRCADGSKPTIPEDVNVWGWEYSGNDPAASVGSCYSPASEPLDMYCDVTVVYNNGGPYLETIPPGASAPVSTPVPTGPTAPAINPGLCGGVGQPACNNSSQCGGNGQPACHCGGIGEPRCPTGTNAPNPGAAPATGGGGTGTEDAPAGGSCGGPGQYPCNVAGQCGGANQPPCAVDLGQYSGATVGTAAGHNALGQAYGEGVQGFNDAASGQANHGWSWMPGVPSAGCTVEPFVVGTYQGGMDLCPAASRVSELLSWVFAILTMYALFYIFTGTKSEG